MINESGQSLVEALVALGAAVIIVSAVAIAVITAQNNADFSKNQNLATQYARQGMEVLRQIRETSWQTFSSFSGTYCLSQSSTTLTPSGGTSCPVNISSFFIRSVTINQNYGGCSGGARVATSVFWSDGKCASSNPYCHDVTLESCLTNINKTLSL